MNSRRYSVDETIAEYLDFVGRCRADLKYALEVVHQKHKPDSEEGKAVYAWCVALGALCHDVSGACADLIRSRYYRASDILCRCLFEYSINLEFYRLEPAEALKDINGLEPNLKRLFEREEKLDPNHPNEFSEEDKRKLAAWIDNAEGKPGFRRVFDVFKRVNPQEGEDLYYAVYGRWSAYVHGNVLSIMDLVGPDSAADKETHIRWQRKRFDAAKQIRWLLHCILWTLRSAERISDRGDYFSRLKSEFESLVKTYEPS